MAKEISPITHYYDLVFKWSRRQDSNLRRSATKNLKKYNAALGFKVLANFLLDYRDLSR